MSRFADLDRDGFARLWHRACHIAILGHAFLLAVEALEYATGRSTDFWTCELKNRITNRIKGFSDAELAEICALLDSLYD